MKRALPSLAATLALICGSAGAASAAGLAICNSTGGTVGYALGYVGAEGLTSTGPFKSEPGQCATLLTEVAKGPFYIYGEELTGAMAWTGQGDGLAQAFCLSRAPDFVLRNKDYMKDGKLVCPEDAAIQFMLVPDVPRGRPQFTFSEDNADRP